MKFYSASVTAYANKIGLIRYLRLLTNCSLREAVDYLEQHDESLLKLLSDDECAMHTAFLAEYNGELAFRCTREFVVVFHQDDPLYAKQPVLLILRERKQIHLHQGEYYSLQRTHSYEFHSEQLAQEEFAHACSTARANGLYVVESLAHFLQTMAPPYLVDSNRTHLDSTLVYADMLLERGLIHGEFIIQSGQVSPSTVRQWMSLHRRALFAEFDDLCPKADFTWKNGMIESARIHFALNEEESNLRPDSPFLSLHLCSKASLVLRVLRALPFAATLRTLDVTSFSLHILWSVSQLRAEHGLHTLRLHHFSVLGVTESQRIPLEKLERLEFHEAAGVLPILHSEDLREVFVSHHQIREALETMAKWGLPSIVLIELSAQSEIPGNFIVNYGQALSALIAAHSSTLRHLKLHFHELCPHPGPSFEAWFRSFCRCAVAKIYWQFPTLNVEFGGSS